VRVRPITVLCLVYIAVIFYGTLLPFDMTADVDAAIGRLERELTVWYDGFFNNRRDILLNVAFFIPLGILVAVGYTGKSRWAAVLVAGVVGATVSLTVEFLQLWSPSRTAEAADLVTNTAGCLAGGFIGATMGRSVGSRLTGETSGKWSLRPLRPVAIALLLLLLLDATDPFYPVTHKWMLRQNLTNSTLVLHQGLMLHSWHHWLVCRVGMYAVLSIVLGASAMNRSRRRWVYGAMLAAGFALVTEACKPLIEDRVANIANVAVAACGAGIGMLLGMVFHQRGSLAAKVALAAVLLIGYVSYQECRPAREDAPFDLVWNKAAIQAKIPSGAGWLPGHSFAIGKRRVRYVRPIVRIIAIMAAFTYALSMCGRLAGKSTIKRIIKGALLAGAIGAALQLLKLLIPDHGPNMTKLWSFFIGGALGVWIYIHAPPTRRHTTSYMSGPGGVNRLAPQIRTTEPPPRDRPHDI
jgi:glycopeptide antibiotics resistance protein